MNREARLEAIIFDLKQSIDDLLYEIKQMAEDIKRLKEATGLK